MPKLNTVSLEPEEDDFGYDDIPVAPRQKKTDYAQLPCDNLIEYEDKDFQKITGQPQPFRAYDDEKFLSLLTASQSMEL